MSQSRIERRFAKLKEEGRGGLVTFITAGDPDPETSYRIVEGLPAAGADLIELGMPFSDPMADGPAIQASSQRALKAGMTLSRTLNLAERFRQKDQDTPIVMMGYYNPIYHMGVPVFLKRAADAGVDGLIIVDLPPEEDFELCQPAIEAGLHWIRLATPTTDDARLPEVLHNTSGFIYYVSIMGITGTKSAQQEDVASAVSRLKASSDLPVAVGFGIKTADHVAETVAVADAAVVGSALVERVRANLDEFGKAKPQAVDAALDFVRELSRGTRG